MTESRVHALMKKFAIPRHARVFWAKRESKLLHNKGGVFSSRFLRVALLHKGQCVYSTWLRHRQKLQNTFQDFADLLAKDGPKEQFDDGTWQGFFT